METTKATEVFRFLQEQIHTVVMAVNDENGKPSTCAVDIMNFDADGLYFLTANGKSLYRRLKQAGFLALTGMKGESTMTRIAVSVRGAVREIGAKRLEKLLEKNPYMYEIYPTAQSRAALTVFQLYEGSGDWFDLSKKPIERFSFSFGGMRTPENGYFVTENCTGCGACVSVCPQNCIELNGTAHIRQEHCLHCGNCFEKCPANAIRKSGG